MKCSEGTQDRSIFIWFLNTLEVVSFQYYFSSTSSEEIGWILFYMESMIKNTTIDRLDIKLAIMKKRGRMASISLIEFISAKKKIERSTIYDVLLEVFKITKSSNEVDN